MIISEFLIAHEAGIQMAYQKNILTDILLSSNSLLQSHQAPLELPAVLERRAGLVFLDFLKSLGFLGCHENICNIVNYPKKGKMFELDTIL